MSRRPQFRDRNQAGELLGDRLRSYAGSARICVLALPGQEELALGALASGGALVVNPDVLAAAGLPREQVAQIVEKGEAELARRSRRYRGDRPPLELAGCTVILVDDGLATGATMRAAVLAVR